MANETRIQSLARKRAEAEQRNAAYQALTLEEKISRNSTKVIKKLNKGAK